MFRGPLLPIVFATTVGLGVQVAPAAAYNFAVFTDLSGTRPFSFTNNTTSGTVSVSAPVTFNFTLPTGLGTDDRAAVLTITTRGQQSTTSPASSSGTILDQPINELIQLSLTDVATGNSLLRLTFTGDIVGPANGPSAQLSGADTLNDEVTFTSDYLNFTQPGSSYALSLAAISPSLSIGPGGFLNSFVADITGQFTGNATAIPEPAVAGLLILGPLALVRRRNA